MTAFIKKLLSPIVELRDREVVTSLMMFTYSFLVMTAYTALKPVSRSKFITDLGADNLPLVQFAFGLAVGFVMQGYSAAFTRLPRRWALPITVGGLAAVLVGLLGVVPDGLAVGVDRLLFLQSDARHPGHQPVLDAGQFDLRPPPGQAGLRVHRRRLEPRGHRRLVAEHPGRHDRHVEPAARERGDDGALLRAGGGRPRTREARAEGLAHRRRGRGRRRRRSAAAPEEQPPPPDNRPRHRLCGRRRRHHRAAAEHGGSRHEGRRQHRLRSRASSAQCSSTRRSSAS